MPTYNVAVWSAGGQLLDRYEEIEARNEDEAEALAIDYFAQGLTAEIEPEDEEEQQP